MGSLIAINYHLPLPGCTLPNLGREFPSPLSSPILKPHHRKLTDFQVWGEIPQCGMCKCCSELEPHWGVEMSNEMIRRCWEFRRRKAHGIWCDHHPICVRTRIPWGMCPQILQGPPPGAPVTNLRCNRSVRMVTPPGSGGVLSLVRGEQHVRWAEHTWAKLARSQKMEPWPKSGWGNILEWNT